MKLMMHMPKLSEISQARLVGVAEGLEIAMLEQQEEEKRKEEAG